MYGSIRLKVRFEWLWMRVEDGVRRKRELCMIGLLWMMRVSNVEEDKDWCVSRSKRDSCDAGLDIFIIKKLTLMHRHGKHIKKI